MDARSAQATQAPAHKALHKALNGNGVNHNKKQQPARKSLLVTYLLWLVGGWFGLHHLYLGRDLQAFVWWSTLGGYIGLGWFVDVFRIPEMVRDANEDPAHMEKLNQQWRTHSKPEFSVVRYAFSFLVSYWYAQLILLAIPQDDFAGIDWSYLHWLVPLAGAIGVYMVGNIGRQKGTIYHCLIVAYVIYPIRYFIYDESIWLSLTLTLSALAFDTWSKEFDMSPPARRSWKQRSLYLTAAILLYLAIFGAFLFFNGKISDGDGGEIPVHEAIQHLFTSPWWSDLKQSLIDTWIYAQHHGWSEIYNQILESIDVDGERNAFMVLNLSPTASQGEITSAWRSLSKENHPDKVKDPSKKEEAQIKFMEIQQAYDVLSKIKQKRRRKNKISEDEL